MERVTIEQAKEMFGSNFIGLEELKSLFDQMKLSCKDVKVPIIEYTLSELQKHSDDYILILGLSNLENIKLSILTFRNYFGTDPDVFEPCFYNQDWYINEGFIHETLNWRWYLLKKNVMEESRTIQPLELLKQNIIFPSAILCIYTFFAYYYARHEMLWFDDFVWCNNTDHNGDRVYVGKYHDIDGINKNGFSIHRHLALRKCYAAINCK